jgi:small-conductance mechanosensitive channel
MINVAISFASLLGLLDIGLAVFYLVISIAVPLNRRRMLDALGIALYIAQAVIAPVILLLSGVILFFQGWRLDPILQLAFFLLNVLVIYLGIKDILIYSGRS